MLNRSESGHPYLTVLKFCRKGFSFSLLSIMLAVGFWQFLLCWDLFSLYSFQWKHLSWMDAEFYQITLLHLLKWLFGFCVFFCWCDISYWLFCSVHHYYGPGVNPTWPQCLTLLLRTFASVFITILAYNFPFWYYLCLVLVSGRWWLHRMTLGMFPPLQSLGRVLLGLV